MTMEEKIARINELYHKSKETGLTEEEKEEQGRLALTAFGIYPKITKYGGAGSLVPITGFANSVAAPAIEFKKEGQVFGIGCQIFKIAGPVVLYGVLSSWILGLIYWIVKMING